MTAPLLPAFLKLAGRDVVVVGGGAVAAARVRQLAAAGARVTVVAPEVRDDVAALAAEIHRRPFRGGDLDGAWFAVAAATPAVNRDVARAAEARRILVNAVDDPDRATVYAAGVVRRGEVTVAISTGGAAPALAGLLREALEALLPPDLAAWAELARAERATWRREGLPHAEARPRLLEALDRLYADRRPPVPLAPDRGGAPSSAPVHAQAGRERGDGAVPLAPDRSGAPSAALARAQAGEERGDGAVPLAPDRGGAPSAAPARAQAGPERSDAAPDGGVAAPGDATPAPRSPAELRLPAGFVSLVGAGPGDAGLLTRRGAERLAAADLVLYDALVAPEVLRLAPRARRFLVGKRAGRPSVSQRAIERILVRAARRGERVVRLKCGDPFVFGRGGEEAQALAAAGVPFEVVPGVSSALSAPALAGIPVTHRGLAAGFTVVSGHAEEAYGPILAGLAPGSATVVVLMGLARRAAIAERLVALGWTGATPAAVVLGASGEAAFVWRGALADLGTAPLPADRALPGILVVGAVAALSLVGSSAAAPADPAALAAPTPHATPSARATCAAPAAPPLRADARTA